MGNHTMRAPRRFFFLSQSAHPERGHWQSLLREQMHDTGMGMFMALISIAKIGMRVDMHEPQWRVQRVNHAHHRAIADRMLTAQSDGNMTAPDNRCRQGAQIAHHRFNTLPAINRRMGENTVGARHFAVSQTLQLMAGGNDCGRPFGCACAVRHGRFQAAWHDFKARRFHTVFCGA